MEPKDIENPIAEADFRNQLKKEVIMTESEFCELHSAFYSAESTSLNQIGYTAYTAQHMKEFVEYCMIHHKPARTRIRIRRYA